MGDWDEAEISKELRARYREIHQLNCFRHWVDPKSKEQGLRYMIRSLQLHVRDPSKSYKFHLDVTLEDLKVFMWSSHMYWHGK